MKPKKQNPLLFAAMTLASFTLTVTPSHAADAIWVGNGNQAVGQAIWGGIANWNTNVAATGAGFTATFGTSFTNGYTVTVNTNQTIGTIVFTDPANANDLLLKEQTPNTLTLNNNAVSPVLNVTQSGRTLIMAPVVAGTAGFTKRGLGTLTLTNVNTLSGTVVVSAGTLSLGNSLALQSGLLDTANSVAGGAASGLQTTVTALTLGGLSGNKNLADLFTTPSGGYGAVNALTLNPGAGVVANFSGSIAEGAAGMTLTKIGTGTQTLTGANSYTGATQINVGTLVFGNKAAKTAATATAAAAGSVGLGVKTADAAYFSATDVGSLFNSTLAGFTLDVASGVSIDTTNAGGSFDQTVALTAARTLTKVGTGTLVLSQANTYTGTTTILGGTLALGGTGTLGNSANNLTLSGGTLDLGTLSRTVGALSITAAAVGGNTLANGSLTGTSYAASNATDTALVAANLLVNGTAGFAKSGTGSVTLAGANTYTGVNTVTGGILQFAKTASLYNNNTASWTAANLKAATASTLAFSVGGTNEFTTTHVTTLLTNLGGANGTSANGFAAGSNIGFDTTNAAGGAFTVSNLIANSSGTGGGAVGVTKLGTGTLTLSGVNTYTGATTVSAGTLVLSGARTAAATNGFNVGNLASNTGTLNVTAGTFTVGTTNSSFLIGSGTGATGIMNQTGGSLTTIGNQLLIGNLGATGTYNLSAGTLTTIAGTLGVTVGVNTGSTATFNLSGTGTLTMPATSTLQITRSDNSGASGVTGTFNQTAGTATVGILQMGGSNTAPATANANANATLNLSGGIFAVTTFNQLSGANTSTSAINISGTADVTLPAFPTARGTGSTATLTFDGGTLKSTAASAAYMSGLTSAKIKAGGANFNIDSAKDIAITQALLTDAVSLNGGLTKTGVGALTLAGANTYTGATLVSAGKLQLDGSAAGTLTTSGLTVGAGASLGFTAGAASTLNLTGKTFSLGGTVAFDIGATGVNDALTVGNLTLTANGAFAFNLIGPISGASYTLLTSTNPITTGGFMIGGQTVGKLSLMPTINANTITLTPALAEGSWSQSGGGNWSLGDPALTAGNWTNYKPTVAGDAALFGSAIAGPATITVDTAHSVGYLRFDNVNAVTIGSDASSNLTLDNGASTALVVVTSGSHLIAENVTLASNLIVAPAVGTTLTMSGNLGGVGKGVQLSDVGTLVLSGLGSTYTGATTVNAGLLKLTGDRTGTAGAITVQSGGALAISNGAFALGANPFVVGNGSGISTVSQTGGSVSFSGGTQLIVGNGAGEGIYTLSGGTLTTAAVGNRGIILGVNPDRTGTFNLSDTGTLLMASTSALQIGRSESATAGSNTTGFFNQTGGIATVGALQMGGGNANDVNCTATLNVSGGTFTAVTFGFLSAGTNSRSTINLSGGADVTLPAFPTARGTDSTATITFDGGTLKPRAASTTYLGGLTNAFIKAGGATLDTTSGSITITQALLTDPVSTGGGLTKLGSNTLTLTGTNTHTGATQITGGTLALSGTGSVNGSSGITLNDSGAKLLQTSSVAASPTVTLTLGTVTGSGAVNTVNVADSTDCVISNNNGVAGAALTIGALTFSGAATVNTFSVNNGNSTAAAIVTASLASNAAGTVTINPAAATWTSGSTYNLISYGGGGIGGAGFPKFVLGTVAGKLIRQSAILGDSGTAITLAISGGDSLYWVGDTNNNWNTATINNWRLLSNNSYSMFLDTDDVIFDDNATAAGPINVEIDLADVPTHSTIFNNSTKDYVLSSTAGFGISAGSLTKTGTGKVSIGTYNAYSGGTTVSGGILQLGHASAIGTGPLTLNGGNLDSSVADLVSATNIVQAWNSDFNFVGTQNLNLGTGTVTMNANRAVTVSANTLTVGGITGGAFNLTKQGAGNLKLNGVSTYGGSTTINGGTLEIGGAGTLGSGTYAQAIAIGSGSTVKFTSSAAQTLSGALTGAGALTLDSTANTNTLTLSGTNTYTGATTITSGRIAVAAAPPLSTSTITINGNATVGGQLFVTGTPTVTNNFIIAGVGYPDTVTTANTGRGGAIRASTGQTFSGTITLADDSRIGFIAGTSSVVLSGQITGGKAIDFYAGLTANTVTQTFTLSNTGTPNDYSGNTSITAVDFNGARTGGRATLTLGASNQIPNGTGKGNVVFNGADANHIATLELNGFSETINGVSNTAAAGANIRNTASGASVLTIGDADASGSFSGVISDGSTGKTLAITKIGTGTLTLGGANTYIGGTTVSGGTLAFGTVPGAGAGNIRGSLSIGNGAVVNAGGSWNLGYNLNVSVNSITINQGTLNFSAIAFNGGTAASTITMTGGTIAGNGGGNSFDWYYGNTTAPTLTAVASSVRSTISANLNLRLNAATNNLTFNVASGTTADGIDLMVSGNITATGGADALGGIIKSGAGTMTFSGANTYTAATTVSAGTLSLVGGSQASPITVSVSGALAFTLGSPTTSTSSFNLSAGKIKITGTPTLASYTLITSSTGITGTPTLDAPIPGYALLVDGTALKLVQPSYASWAAINATTGTAADDFDGDGVSNGAEYVLGGTKNTNDLSKLPAISTSGGNVIFTFKRDPKSIDGTTTVAIEVGTDLATWPSPSPYAVPDGAASNVPGVTVVKGIPAGFDTVTLSVPQAPDAKKFARLKVVVTP